MVTAALERGWNVGFSYHSHDDDAMQLVESAAGAFPRQSCRAYPLDVCDAEAIDVVGDRVLQDFSRIDAIICNAGIDLPGNLISLTDDDWARVLRTNVTGTFYLLRHFLPSFIANRYGRIVTVSSLARNGSTGQVAYATSKAGLVGLTQTTAKEYGRFGVTANVLVPGLIDTDIIRGDDKGIRPFFTHYGPSQRLGTAADVASAALFLISRESGYVNGAVLHVTGGIDWVY